MRAWLIDPAGVYPLSSTPHYHFCFSPDSGMINPPGRVIYPFRWGSLRGRPAGGCQPFIQGNETRV